MGMGDEIMVTAQVKRMARESPNIRVAVRDIRLEDGWHRWHSLWSGNPHIVAPGREYDAVLDNGPGNRPYISGKTMRQWFWNEYEQEPGELYLTAQELSLARKTAGRIIVQPFVKASASPNKRWPMEDWQALIAKKPRWPWLQIGDGREPRLGGVEFLVTKDFREACGALSGARLLVSQEGGVHHAAAALGVNAVVIFGGFISPRVTGYKAHTNLFVESEQFPLGCGARVPCFHCHKAMHAIRPHHVIEAIERHM